MAGLTLAGVLALSAGLAHAQVTRSWNNPSGGAASNTLNWLPIGLPAQQDALVYNLNATYSVLFDPAVPVVRAQTFRRGTVSLQIALNHNTFDEFTIGQLAGDVAEARLTQGQLDTQDLILGLNSGSSGTLRLLSPSTSDAQVVRVGIAGAGTLELQPGARLTSTSTLSVGEQASAVGSALITGATSQLSASALSIGSAGSGTLTIGSGPADTPAVLTTGVSSIAPNATGLGEIVLHGGSLQLGTLRIARNTSAAAAGTGELDVRGGQVAAAVIDVGDDQSGSGILRVSGGRVDVGQLSIFGSPTRGQLLLSGGEVAVTGALTVNGALTTTGGRLVLADQSLNLVTTNLTLAGGEVSVQQGSTLEVSGDLRLTVEGADLNLAGTGTVLNTDELVNENSASAPNVSTIRVESGAQAFVRRLRILSGPGDDGLSISNATVEVAEDVEAVNSALRVGVGGVLRAASVSLREGSTSSIDGILSITGPITLNNSTINSSGPVTSTLLESTATGAVTGLVSTIGRFSVGAPLRFTGPQTLRLTPGGVASAMGDQSNPTGVRLACDHVEILGSGGNPPGTLDLRDQSEIELGTTAPASSVTIRLVTLRSLLNLSNSFRVFAGSLALGNADIQHPMFLTRATSVSIEGSVSLRSLLGQPGLTITRVAGPVAPSITVQGDFLGSGSTQVPITVNPSGEFFASGNWSFTNSSGLTTPSLRTTVPGVSIDLSAPSQLGAVQGPGPLTITNTAGVTLDSIFTTGLLQAASLSVSSRVDPAGTGIGALTFRVPGALNTGANLRLVFDFTPTQTDQMLIDCTLWPFSGIVEVRGPDPSAWGGDSFERELVALAPGATEPPRIGQISQAILPPTAVGSLRVEDRGARIVLVWCRSDFDRSGFVDSDDFVSYLAAFTRGCVATGEGPFGPDPACERTADFDASGFVDSDDFVAFVASYQAGCP